MAKPTITYGHGYVTDCDSLTNWSSQNSGILNPAAAVEIGDIFELEGTCDDAGDELYYIEYDITNITQASYPKFLFRWRTSAASNGLGAKVELVFDDASTQMLFGTSVPQFNTDWTVTGGNVTSGKTVDKVRFYMDDYPNSIDSGTFWVQYDFLILYAGIFTFPSVRPGGITMQFPERYLHIPIPGRGNPITQRIGAREPIIITLRGAMMQMDTWGSANYKYGEYMLKVWRNQLDAPFFWFTSDRINCKVTPRAPILRQLSDSDGAQCIYDYPLALYSLSDIGESAWDDLQWLGIEV